MEKIKVKIKVNDYKIENSGILEDEIITTQDKDTEVIFNLNSLTLQRKNKELDLTIDFKNKSIIYKIPETNQKFINNFIVISLTNEKKKVNIKYRMEENIFEFSLTYETINQ